MDGDIIELVVRPRALVIPPPDDPAQRRLWGMLLDLSTLLSESIARDQAERAIEALSAAVREIRAASLVGSNAAPTLSVAIPEQEEFTSTEAAAFLGVSTDTLKRYFELGLLPRRDASPPGSGKPRYRYRRADLELLIRRGYHKACPWTESKSKRPRAKPAERNYEHLDL